MKLPGIKFIERDTSFIKTGVPAQTSMVFIGQFDKGPALRPMLVTQNQLRQVFQTQVTAEESQKHKSFAYIATSKYLEFVNQAMIVRVLGNNFSNSSTQIYGSESIQQEEGESEDLDVMVKFATIGDGAYANTSEGGLKGYRIEIDNFRWGSEENQMGSMFDVHVYFNNRQVQVFRDCSLRESDANYIKKIIGDMHTEIVGEDIEQVGQYINRSKHIYVEQVNADYPYGYIQQRTFRGGDGHYYAFEDGSDGDAIVDADYEFALNLMDNKDLYDIQVIVMPEKNLIDDADLFKLANEICMKRDGDCMVIADACGEDVNYAAAIASSPTSEFNSSYIAAYYNPTLIRYDGNNIYVPASVLLPKVYAYNDLVRFKWFAAAGHNRGRIEQGISVKYKLNDAKRKALYEAGINPIAYFVNDGVCVYGQKTLQLKKSAVSSINVRRLSIYIIKRFTIHFLRTLWENNTVQTRTQLYNQLKSLMDTIKANQGVYHYEIILDDSLNTPEVIDNLELHGQLYIQPARAIEGIRFGINITSTGASMVQVSQGPTKRAIDYRIDQSYPESSPNNPDRNDPRVIVIPVYEDLYGEGDKIKEITIVGFVGFYIEEVIGQGNDNHIYGYFVEMMTTGEIGEGENLGLKSIKLVN